MTTKLTKLQEAALNYFVEGGTETPKNYCNNLHALRSKGLILESKSDDGIRYAGNKMELTDSGNSIYHQI